MKVRCVKGPTIADISHRWPAPGFPEAGPLTLPIWVAGRGFEPGHIHQHLPGEVVRPGQPKGRKGPSAVRGVDYQLALGRGLREACDGHRRVGGKPNREGRTPPLPNARRWPFAPWRSAVSAPESPHLRGWPPDHQEVVGTAGLDGNCAVGFGRKQ